MKLNSNSRRRNLFLAATLGGACTITAGWGISAWAQLGVGGTTAAVSGGAALGAAAGAGLPTAGQVTRNVGNGRQNDQNALIDEAGNAGGAAAAGGAGGVGGAQVTVRVQTQQPLNWGPGTSGDQLVQQLMTPRYPAQGARARTPRRQAAYSRNVSRQTPRQRSRAVLSKYRKPPVNYLAWYLPADRYKVTSKVWQFVTTPNDRFYYRPWAPAMKLRSPARVIGFHTWQDAMIAGYRPDPSTRPEPAAQLSYFAGLTRGPNLSRYFEFVYAGQITPATLDSHVRYVRYVAGEVGRHAHTRKLVGSTVEQVLGALTGEGSFPTSVGGTRVTTTTEVSMGGPTTPPPANLIGGDMGSADKREDAYNQFGNRAGNLARKPGS